MSVRQVTLVGFPAVPALLAVACGDDAGDESFKVGVMESLTGPGETYGTVSSQAKQPAVDELNAAGGIDGRA